MVTNAFEQPMLLNPFPVLCSTARCSAFDGDHLSAHGNRALYRVFRGLVTEIWADAEGR